MHTRVILLSVFLASGLLITACGGKSDSTPPVISEPPVEEAPPVVEEEMAVEPSSEDEEVDQALALLEDMESEAAWMDTGIPEEDELLNGDFLLPDDDLLTSELGEGDLEGIVEIAPDPVLEEEIMVEDLLPPLEEPIDVLEEEIAPEEDWAQEEIAPEEDWAQEEPIVIENDIMMEDEPISEPAMEELPVVDLEDEDEGGGVSAWLWILLGIAALVGGFLLFRRLGG